MTEEPVQGEGGLVAGVFRDGADADKAVAALRQADFPDEAIGVMTRERADLPEGAREALQAEAAGDGVAKAASRGLVAGGVLGAVGGIALEATVLAIPGAGPFLAGGSIAAALMGGATGAGAGALSAALVRLGMSRSEADEVERALASGQALATVGADDRFVKERARRVLRQQGALETRDVERSEAGPEFIRGFAEVEPRLREHFTRRSAGSGARWEDHQARYIYGWQLANRPDFRERSWADAQVDIREEWEIRHPEVPWSDARAAVEEAWRAAGRD